MFLRKEKYLGKNQAMDDFERGRKPSQAFRLHKLIILGESVNSSFA